MGTTYDQIIQISITDQTTPLDVAGFSNILVFGKNPTFSERAKLYSASELATLAGQLTGGTASAEYKAVSSIFAQKNHPTTVMVGRQGSSESEVDGLAAIIAENNNWYAIIYPAHDDTKADEIAAWAEANAKIFMYASNETVMYSTPGTDTTSFAHVMKDAAYARTGAIYSADADVSFADAAILSVLLPKDAGTYNPGFKTLTGVAVDSLSGSNASNVHAKYASTYESLGGRNVFLFGRMASGGFLDTIIFTDVLKARLQEEIYGLLVRQDKVSFDDLGIAQIEQAIRTVIKRFQVTGAITPDAFDADGNRTGGFDVTVPSAASISTNDKAARTLKDITFVCFYSGAVNTIEIDGVIQL